LAPFKGVAAIPCPLGMDIEYAVMRIHELNEVGKMLETPWRE